MALVLLDTSALFAGIDADDPNYASAHRYFAKQSNTYLVADTIFSEAATLIRHRLGVGLAVGVGTAILAGDPFRLHRLTVEEAEESWRIFCRFTDKDWSYADCSLLALSQHLQIGEVFAFDRHFDQMAALGLRRVP